MKKTIRTYKMPIAQQRALKAMHEDLCDEIMNDVERQNTPMHMPLKKKHSRWQAGFCLICGERMDCITNYHANLHGYKSADELIKAGKIKFE